MDKGDFAVLDLPSLRLMAQLTDGLHNMEHAACCPGMAIAHQAAMRVAGKLAVQF